MTNMSLGFRVIGILGIALSCTASIAGTYVFNGSRYPITLDIDHGRNRIETRASWMSLGGEFYRDRHTAGCEIQGETNFVDVRKTRIVPVSTSRKWLEGIYGIDNPSAVPDSAFMLQISCSYRNGGSGGVFFFVFENCGQANQAARELGLPVGNNACSNAQKANSSASSSLDMAQRQKQSVPRICPDGSPMPANSTCPTITFKSREQQEREAAANRAAEAQRQAAAQQQALLAAQAEERRRAQQLQDDLEKLTQSPSVLPSGPMPPLAREVDEAIEETTSKPTLGDLARDALKDARQAYRDLLVRIGDCIRLRTCMGSDSSQPTVTTPVSGEDVFNGVQARGLLNAIPPLGLGYYIYGNRNVDDVGRMLDTWEATQ